MILKGKNINKIAILAPNKNLVLLQKSFSLTDISKQVNFVAPLGSKGLTADDINPNVMTDF